MSIVALVMLWLAYFSIGWHLSAYHIIEFIGVAIAVFGINIIWTSISLEGGPLGYFPQVLIMVLLISGLIAFTATRPILFTLIVPPALTTTFAWYEIQSWGIKKSYTRLILVGFAMLGLGVGEVVDLLLLPGVR
jgi:hypothetical protein